MRHPSRDFNTATRAYTRKTGTIQAPIEGRRCPTTLRFSLIAEALDKSSDLTPLTCGVVHCAHRGWVKILAATELQLVEKRVKQQ